eukprot:8894918-Pyramimonas_sp.AAC.1
MVPKAGGTRGSDEPRQPKMCSVPKANSVPREESNSFVGGRPLENKRPRTNTRYLSHLPSLL